MAKPKDEIVSISRSRTRSITTQVVHNVSGPEALEPPTRKHQLPDELEQIAAEICVDISDASEPLSEMFGRLRSSLEERRFELTTELDCMEDELDQIESDMFDADPEKE